MLYFWLTNVQLIVYYNISRQEQKVIDIFKRKEQEI